MTAGQMNIGIRFMVIVIVVAVLIGAILTFVKAFKKHPGSLGKKGLFATAMLSVYALFIQALPHTSFYWKQFLIPLLGFSVLSILDFFKKENE